MSMTTDDLIKIARAGGGFIIDTNGRTDDDLIRIATAAAQGGGTVTIQRVRYKRTIDLVEIAVAGRGHVVFDFLRE